MRVSIDKTTGLLIEAQSNDAADLQVLVDNAIAAGYPSDNVETKVVNDADYQALLQALPQPVSAPSQLDMVIAYIATQPNAPAALVQAAAVSSGTLKKEAA